MENSPNMVVWVSTSRDWSFHFSKFKDQDHTFSTAAFEDWSWSSLVLGPGVVLGPDLQTLDKQQQQYPTGIHKALHLHRFPSKLQAQDTCFSIERGDLWMEIDGLE